jgi:hypothetical protein
MRIALGAVAAAALLSAPLAAAELDPGALVLRQSDVPAGFEVDRVQTGSRTNEQEAKSDPRAAALFERWGRVTGYEAGFDRGSASIDSRADLLRTAKGARMLLDFFELEMRKGGIKGLVRSRVRLGAEGWVYRGRSPFAFTVVAWRYKRVFAGVAGMGISRDGTLALARVQQRRIAAALR